MKHVSKSSNGTCVVLPSEQFSYPRISCSLCGKLYITVEDQIADERYQTCDICMHYFVLPNSANWSSGWRPDEQVVNEHLNTRVRLVKTKMS